MNDMDLEGIARRLIHDKEKAREKLVEELSFYKSPPYPIAEVSSLVIEEVEISLKSSTFSFVESGLKAWEAGLGSRGTGDHLIHEALFRISQRSLSSFDDAGIEEDVIVSVDGIHSRLSYFPFLAGFHATRATLRDIMVKGARPLGIIVDIHLSDDSDIAMLTDFEAGVSTIAEYMGLKILAGSTLRIGGDLVIGERISGGVASVGKVGKKRFLRSNIREGNFMVMTEGNGGGTIATTAIYHGIPEVVNSTLSLKDLISCRVISEAIPEKVDSMTDVTNGGIRSISSEVNTGREENTKVTLEVNKSTFVSLINPAVRKMLESLSIDPLGLSIDSILIFTDYPDDVVNLLKSYQIKSKVIGKVERFNGHNIISEDGEPLTENFRESPYTPVKKAIGNWSSYSMEEIQDKVNRAVTNSLKKKDQVLKNLKTGNAYSF